MDGLILLALVACAVFGRHEMIPHAAFAFGPLVAAGVAAGAGGLISSWLGGKSKTVGQYPLETPEQAQARRDLLKFGENGSIDGYSAGTPYTGSMGDFNLSPTEQAGQGLLAKFVSAGRSPLFDAASKNLNDLLTSGKYDPNDPNGEYSTFKTQAAHELTNSIRDTKRGLAYTGDLYSTDAGRQISTQVQNSNDALASKLAELSDKYVTRKLNAIPLAGQMAAQGNALDLAPITAAATFGGAQRTLNTASDQANYAEWIRQRQEQQARIDALKSVSTTPSNFGVPSATSTKPNPFGSFIGNASSSAIQQLIAQYLAGGGGESDGGQIAAGGEDGGGTFFGPSNPTEKYFQ